MRWFLVLLVVSAASADHRPTVVSVDDAGNTWLEVYHWGLVPSAIWIRGDNNQPLVFGVNLRQPDHYRAMFLNYGDRSFTVRILYTAGLVRTITYVAAGSLSDVLDPAGAPKSWGQVKSHFLPVLQAAVPYDPTAN